MLFPDFLFKLIGMSTPEYLPLWQVVGMFVLVYAPAYWWAGRNPEKHPHLIIIGLLGKIFGPIGFVFSVLTNQLPLSFGVTIIFNDLIWWPAFFMYLRDIAQNWAGLLRLLSGD